MTRRSELWLLPGIAGIALAYFIAFAALVLLARLLVLAWLFILLPLELPVLASNSLAIMAAGISAFACWRLVRCWLHRRATPQV